MSCDSRFVGPHPYDALSQIYGLALFDAIFIPPIDTLPELRTEDMSIATAILHHILSSPESLGYSNLKQLAENKSEQYIAWLLASLSPWKGHMFEGLDTRRDIPAAATAAREGLKMNTKIYNTIISAYRNYKLIQDTVQKDATERKLPRSKMGMFIRKLGVDWRSQYFCALILETIPLWMIGETAPNPQVETVLLKYSAFLAQVKEMGLKEAFALKTILNVSCVSLVR